jgi:hypothetical protein
MTKLFVLVTGYGRPETSLKEQLLHYNIQRILSHSWTKVDFHLCMYDDTPSPSYITGPPHFKLHIHRETGIVGDFIRRYMTKERLESYDYVLMMLDDVLLMENINFAKLIEWKREFQLNIISPSLTLDSKHIYKYMLTQPDGTFHFKISPACEYFVYFMDPQTAIQYASQLTDENPWIWGVDLILYRHLHLKVAITNHMTIKHYIQGSCHAMHPDRPPTDGYNSLLTKYGEPNDHELTMLPTAFYYIYEAASPASAKPSA